VPDAEAVVFTIERIALLGTAALRTMRMTSRGSLSVPQLPRENGKSAADMRRANLALRAAGLERHSQAPPERHHSLAIKPLAVGSWRYWPKACF
jgi:hypothetical protein